MNPELASSQRFVAANMSQAMRLLSQAYGADAVIVSTRKVEGGVELYGMPASEVPPPKTLLERRRARALRKRQLGADPSVNTKPLQRSSDTSSDALQDKAQDNLGSHLKRSDVEPRPVSLAAIYGPRGPLQRAVPEEESGANPLQKLDVENASDDFLDDWDFEDDAARLNEASFFSVPLQRSSDEFVADSSLDDPRLGESLDRLGGEASNDSLGDGAALETIKQELAELRRRVKRHEGMAEQQRDIFVSVENIEAGRELFAMGISLPVIKAVLAQMEQEDNTGVDARAASAMLRFKSLLPLYSMGQIDDGLYTVVAGRKAEQASLLAKLALSAVVSSGSENVAILTTNENSNYFRRLARLSGITVHRALPDELLEAVQALSRYSHVFVDSASQSAQSTDDSVLDALRALRLGHHEVLSLHGSADIEWTRGQIDHWRSDCTRFCLLSEADELANRGAFISLLIEKKLPLAGVVEDPLMPDSIKSLSRGAIMSYLSQNDAQGKQAAVPIVY